MKNLLKIFGLGAALAFMTAGLQATPISLTPSSTALASGPDTSQSAINAAIAPWVGSSDPLYKGEQNPSGEEGSFAGSYTTTWETLTPASAVISYDGGPFIDTSPVYALIKGGKVVGGLGTSWYLYDISGWNGTDNIEFSGYYGGNQDRISHVSIYGVPDGGATALLLGLGLLGVSLAALRFKSSKA